MFIVYIFVEHFFYMDYISKLTYIEVFYSLFM